MARGSENPMKIRLGSRGLEVSRVINGLCQWPLDDTSSDSTDALRSMDRLAEAGLATFQLGNAAGGGRALAERRAAAFLQSAAGAASGSREVRFLNTLGLRQGVPVTRKAVKAALELSLCRMGVERLDLVQLCWRDFEDRYFLDALCYLEESECVSNVGVCGFPAGPLALAGANGFSIVSNLVASSLIKTPGAGGAGDGASGGQQSSGGGGSGGKIMTLARQCREQGVAMISSSGASLGGFAADEWVYRRAPPESAFQEGLFSPDSRQALSDILAWGSRCSIGSDRDGSGGDPWRAYQLKLLPELQAVARKHGRGLTPADVATAFHLCTRTTPPAPCAGATDNPGAGPGGSDATGVPAAAELSAAAAVTIPVRVISAGSLSARRAAEAEESRASGRRGAELAEMLDLEDVERLAAAVALGNAAATRSASSEVARSDWEHDMLGRVEGEDDEQEGGRGDALWEVRVDWEGPKIFL